MSISLDLGKRYIGLTNLSATLVDINGTDLTVPINLGFVEIGNGNYLWTYSAYPQNFRGGIKFKSGTELIGFIAVNPEELEYIDVRVSSRAGAGGVSIITQQSPVPTDITEPIELRLIDDYFAAEGRSIDLTSDQWPDLAGATVQFIIAGKETFIKNFTIIDDVLRLELSSAELAIIGAGRWSYEVKATLYNGHVLTLLVANMIIVPPFGD
jgi:hypothetical protein